MASGMDVLNLLPGGSARTPWVKRLACALLLLSALAAALASNGDAWAQTEPNVRQTKHNLSKNAPAANTVKSTNVDQVCIFCHTPHAATIDAGTGQPIAPLWNRKLSSASYDTYGSKSLDALGAGETNLGQPGGTSKLCLSCHDGTLAIGQIGVLNGKANPTVTMTGTEADDTMPVGGAASGFTRRLGKDLSNDHPISFTYNDALATKDGELRKPSLSGTPRMIDSRGGGNHPTLPLESGQMQCTTCHDPHLYDPADPNRKFLRLNRLQKNAGPTTTFNSTNDLICLACHAKEGYAESAHADSSVAVQKYDSTAAAARGFPTGTKVWEASCLNCHDPHTSPGARRLTRGGVDGSGNSATEEVCYACHASSRPALDATDTATSKVPDIKTDFTAASPGTHMPITQGSDEAHNITNADGTEPTAQLGISSRHVECPDCHNPHRVRKSKNFDGTGGTTSGTHTHDQTGNTAHTNTISGVLRGSWGVEPTYASTITSSFGTLPTGFEVKRGDPGASVATDVGQSYVTREYQICLKCHSKYAYGTTPPNLGTAPGATPSYGYTDSGGLRTHSYTDQSMEFQAPTDDRGEKSSSPYNHRSWHPVMAPTGRTPTVRGNAAMNANWLGPFKKAVGTQTMYCSDCHGSNVTTSGTVIPDGNVSNEDGNPWGPHGSSKTFILKAPWSDQTGQGTPNDLCFHCHDFTQYTAASDKTAPGPTGFYNGTFGNLHRYHVNRIQNVLGQSASKWRCSYCHVAIPHGWKNKALLANLNDVGPEVGLPAGTSASPLTNKRYYRAPYYMGAVLRIVSWAKSGSWQSTDCGQSGSNNSKPWMTSACGGIP